jgi:hypothetical protein
MGSGGVDALVRVQGWRENLIWICVANGVLAFKVEGV